MSTNIYRCGHTRHVPDSAEYDQTVLVDCPPCAEGRVSKKGAVVNMAILHTLSRAEHWILNATAPAKSKEGVLKDLRYAIRRIESGEATESSLRPQQALQALREVNPFSQVFGRITGYEACLWCKRAKPNPGVWTRADLWKEEYHDSDCEGMKLWAALQQIDRGGK